ncbi:hypothetical protein [Desulfosporosinus shakirovi]|nr:hypothetical protein [Desulfosporosinus sp. SRJS8]MCB8817440.1 hypothetical protein [Desulfosporosinus sp. SRJS8]
MSTQELKISYTGADPTAFGVLGLSMVCFANIKGPVTTFIKVCYRPA